MEPAATQTSDTQAGDKPVEVAGQARERAEHATGQAKAKLREQVDQRSTQAGDQVAAAAKDVRTVGAELEKQGKERPAQVANQAAERAERLGDYLRRSDADLMLADLEGFGRRRPWAVAAGGVALGFAASRFLKASSRQRFESRSGQGGSLPRSAARTSPGEPPIPPSYDPSGRYVVA